MMKVLFDARFITPQKTGVGRFANSLLTALDQVNGDIEIHALIFNPISSLSRIKCHQAPVAFDSHPHGDIYRNFQLLNFLQNEQFDVFFSPAFYCIQRKCPVQQIVVVHDLAVFDQPENYSKKFGFYLRRMIRSACKNSDGIIASSQYISNRIIDRFPKTANIIKVIPFGVSDIFRTHDEKSTMKVKEELCLPDNFILNVSTIEPRKNLLTLLDAYSIYRRRVANPMPLILVGKEGYKAEIVRKRAFKVDLEFSVRFLNYISDQTIAKIYRLARMMVYPSIYEGFGLPVLEAMASGCPVITSKVASIPEVAGEAAVMVDPLDPVAIAQEMIELSNDSEKYNRLSRLGKTHSEQFTWVQVANRVVDYWKKQLENK